MPAFGSNATICFNPPGDGSCQFEAYAHQLNKIGIYTSGASARVSAVNYMLKNPYIAHENKKTHLFQFVDKHDHEDWDSYLTAMKRRATYGNNLTLQALSNVYRYNVRILVVTAAATHLQTNIYHLIEPTCNDLESVAAPYASDITVNRHIVIMFASHLRIWNMYFPTSVKAPFIANQQVSQKRNKIHYFQTSQKKICLQVIQLCQIHHQSQK